MIEENSDLQINKFLFLYIEKFAENKTYRIFSCKQRSY